MTAGEVRGVPAENLREAVAQVLGRLYCPMTREELEVCLINEFDTTLSQDEFAGLVSAERHGREAGALREYWLCPALQWPGFSADPAKLTRSDWELRHRFTGPALETARRYWLTREFCGMAMAGEEHSRGSIEPIRRKALEMVKELPADEVDAHVARQAAGSGTGREMPDAVRQRLRFGFWREVADDSYNRIALDYAATGERAAHQAQTLSVTQQLFGV